MSAKNTSAINACFYPLDSLPFQQQLFEERERIRKVKGWVFQEVLQVNAAYHQLSLQLRVHHLT